MLTTKNVPLKKLRFILKYTEVPDITLQMIIEAGILTPGTTVHAATDDKVRGILNKDGSITLNFNNQEQTFPYPSGAARAVTRTSVNGWIFWKIKEDGQTNDLSYYKKKYIEAQN